jgi:transcriptional regulator with XRE-family HTH domain
MALVISNKLRSILTNEFQARIFRNPSYSLRSFSRDLIINVSTLSRLMRGESLPSKFTIDRVSQKISINAEDLSLIHHEISVFNEHKITKNVSQNAILHVFENEEQIDLFQMYLAPAFLEYLRLVPESYDDLKASVFFNTSVDEIISLKEHLISKNLIKIIDGKIINTFDCLTFETPKESGDFINNIHTVFHEKAIKCIHDLPQETWLQSSFTIAIDESIMAEVKSKVTQFTRELTNFIDSKSKTQNNVYTFQASLFPWGPPSTNKIESI